ncbi:MAG TPA: transcription elongation factor GreA [Longimicrobiales bacterium]
MLEEIKARLSEELERLGHELNVVLPAAIRKAAELGDLSENAEYQSALDRQRFVQARINQITQRMGELSRIEVQDLPVDRVGFGSRVRVKDLGTGEEAEYTIVTGDFIDLEAGHISMASPLGRALLGRAVGEEVAVQLPAGQRRFAVLELTTIHDIVS